MKSSKTAQKLKEEIEVESDMEMELNIGRKESDVKVTNEIVEVKQIHKQLDHDQRARPSFKNVGFKILLGRKAFNQNDDFSHMIINDLEQNLMKEYFEIEDKMFNSRFIHLFSKYV